MRTVKASFTTLMCVKCKCSFKTHFFLILFFPLLFLYCLLLSLSFSFSHYLSLSLFFSLSLSLSLSYSLSYTLTLSRAKEWWYLTVRKDDLYELTLSLKQTTHSLAAVIDRMLRGELENKKSFDLSSFFRAISTISQNNFKFIFFDSTRQQLIIIHQL